MLFKETDVVVFQGAITTYGVIKPLVQDETEVRLATKEERDLYNLRPTT